VKGAATFWTTAYRNDAGRRARPPDPRGVPTISWFYGVTIRMYWADHAPPHFHAIYAGHEAVIAIETATVIRGVLPARAKALTLEWSILHREELLANWELCARNQTPKRIRPLD
jgi:hypothetical protein